MSNRINSTLDDVRDYYTQSCATGASHETNASPKTESEIAEIASSTALPSLYAEVEYSDDGHVSDANEPVEVAFVDHDGCVETLPRYDGIVSVPIPKFLLTFSSWRCDIL